MKFLSKKLGYALVTLWVVITLTFFLMKLLPGDPFTYEQGIPEAIQIALRQRYGLNDSFFSQYTNYLSNFLKGDLGISLLSGRSVNALIGEAFPISALLAIEALSIAIPLGVILGSIAALKRDHWQDHFLLILSIIGLAVPNFILATLLQYTFAFKFEFFPIARWGTVMHTVLPAITLATAPTIFLARLVRSSILDILKQDYIKTALAKGLPYQRILNKHILRNALPSLLPYLGQLAANILVGSFIVEKIFSIPGLGQWFVNSVGNRDYGNIMGLTLFYSLVLLSILLIADLLYGWLDPRIRLSE